MRAQPDLSATDDDLLRRLVASFGALELAHREALVPQLRHLIEQAEAKQHRPGRQASRLNLGSAAPVRICDWATNDGLDGSTQRLTIDMTPCPTRVAKTRAATGRSLVSNGHLGADLLHLPA